MLLDEYLAHQCAIHSIRRGQIPALLQFKNSNKALRRYDALLAGNLHDEDLLDRIRACPLLCGDGLDEALARTKHKRACDAREKAKVQELRARRAFTPHLWVIHERSVPSPIFVVAFFGVETFKRVELPDIVLAETAIGGRLVTLASFLADNLRDPSYLASPFGRAVQVLYRDTYDHSFVFDVAEGRFTHELHEAPPVGRAFLTLLTSTSLTPIRKER
jgi:hypothetical protein